MNTTRMMLLAVAAGLLASALSGCDSPVPGLRFAPSEEIKQTTQAGADIAATAAYNPPPPGSPAAVRLAAAARTASTYVGQPSQPIDVSAYFPPAIRDAWRTIVERAERLKLKRDIQARTTEVTSRALTDLLAEVTDKTKVEASDLIHRVQAIVAVAAMGQEISQAVPVPEDPQMSEADARTMVKLDLLLQRTGEAADEQAARRPTIGDVEDKSLDALEKVGEALSDYGLLTLIPGAGVGYYAIRKRKAAKAAKAEADQAKHDAMNAEERATMAAQDKATVVTQAMDRLAAAVPPVAGPAASAPLGGEGPTG